AGEGGEGVEPGRGAPADTEGSGGRIGAAGVPGRGAPGGGGARPITVCGRRRDETGAAPVVLGWLPGVSPPSGVGTIGEPDGFAPPS
ncbi:MAG: hypothetical protein KF782_35425, partial [Labilithrix sp.]|nr:hypothetical protein [Labilithrix sp.]